MHFETQILYITWTWVYGNKQIDKREKIAKEQKKRRKGPKSKQKTTPKNAKHTMGYLKKKSWNQGCKPIIISTKQVVQRDGRKTYNDTKLLKNLSFCSMQNNGDLNFLKNQ
jgi:hypothetical protein